MLSQGIADIIFIKNREMIKPVYIEWAIVVALCWVIIWLTLPFEQKYDERLREFSREPLFRILLGLLLINSVSISVPVALLLFLITFFLITDVHLISTIKI
jgi:hypothetical protein